ncbi:hypothetical protein VNO77_46237 [Canavalia gladiata]|uniref:Uncharacterized protein n=1 Tax=Canavalia gladiata TaxID=3824 RepID=A0AAN9JIR5_CANGL
MLYMIFLFLGNLRLLNLFFCRQNLKRLAGPNSDELLRDHREFSRDGTVSRAFRVGSHEWISISRMLLLSFSPPLPFFAFPLALTFTPYGIWFQCKLDSHEKGSGNNNRANGDSKNLGLLKS